MSLESIPPERSAVQLLERAAEGGGQLLRVESLLGRSGEPPFAFLLTFDVGRILLMAEAGRLRGDQLLSRHDGPSGMVDVGEDEPWWRLMGQRITRADVVNEGGVDMQFRGDAENPRIVRLQADAGAIRIEPPS